MAYEENTNYAAGGLSGAGSGALLGAAVGGPIGALVGGGIGLATGLLGAGGQNSAARAQRRAEEAQRRAQEAEMRRRAQSVALAKQQFGDVWGLGPEPEFREWGGSGGRRDQTGKGALLGAAIGTAALGGLGGGIGASVGGLLGHKRKRSATPYGNNQAEIDAHRARVQAAILRHGQIAGNIESNAQAVRDAGMAQLTGAGQQAAVAQRAASVSRGLLGSSLDDSARRTLLGQYAANRANVTQATEAARQSGWDAVRGQQHAFEAAARGGADVNSQLQRLSVASQIAGARAQMPYITFGNLLNSGMALLDAGMRSEAAGGRGLTALGLPRLGVGSGGDKPSGVAVSQGR
jgi:hypothetical protein